MQIIPRIYMPGNCAEAIELYKEALGARTENLITFGSVGAGSEAQKDLIMNAQLDIGGHKLQLGDQSPAQVVSGSQVSFTVVMNEAHEVAAVFDKLKAGGRVVMEPSQTFFSPCHCAVVDRFGVMWQINCPKK